MQRDTAAATATTGTSTSGRVSAVATSVPAEPPWSAAGPACIRATDFVKVLQSLLRSLGTPPPAAESESGPESSFSSPPKATRPRLRTRETVKEIFRLQLIGTQRNMLEILMDGPRVTWKTELLLLLPMLPQPLAKEPAKGGVGPAATVGAGQC